ncbi:MAG: hypothetical protein ACKV2V_26895, partial [Blastocatellia bacterium]
REVAIKVLPADFANDPERLRRFEQEARATSALNQPNILTVFDFGSHESSPYPGLYGNFRGRMFLTGTRRVPVEETYP